MTTLMCMALWCIGTGLFVALFLLYYNRKDRFEIIRFVKKVILYSMPLIIVLSLYLFHYRRIAPQMNGISMNDQIVQSFNNVLKQSYQMTILGNSRTYRGINPELIDLSTYNFSFDNETFFEQYYKLRYLKEQKKLPRYIVLGVDYFEFGFLSIAMKDSYMNFFNNEYDSLLNVISNQKTVQFVKSEKIDDYVNSTMTAVFSRGGSQFFNFLWKRIIYGTVEAPYLKGNGQYIIRPTPEANAGDFMTRDSFVESYQKEKFEQIIDFARENKIIVFLVMPPCRDIELVCYPSQFKKQLDDYFNRFCIDGNVWYFNYSNSENYKLVDFMDGTHLNPLAADRFTTELNKDIKKVIFDDIQ